METLRIHDYRSSKIPDNIVIKRVLNGEKELFEILLRRYNQTLFRVIRSYIKDDDDIEDVMQDTYLKSYEKLDQFKGDSAFSTWLIRIGINEALQRIRRNKRSMDINVKQENDEANTIISMSDYHKITPETQTINKEMLMLIEKAIDQLPEKYRIVFMLREVEGLNNTEVGECLNITGNNVKIRLHRAKNLLKEILYKISPKAEIFEFGDSRCDKIVDYVLEHI